ncbi:MAG: sugar phosphate nucleotidyltransferase [Candidatus Absconditabacteria bacterium]|nr:sugar phosphate nucleotidyltransferase [Candidatus Absconditabacteria bacterium]
MNLTLVILAAGMGSRYGRLKQLDGFGPNEEILMEYSIYDAIKAGFNKVIFVIRQDFAEEFKDRIGNKLNGKIKVEYAYQEKNALPEGFKLPETREKPRGTGHAILAATTYINEPFAVINADDFYGEQSYKTLANFLKNPENVGKCSIVGYQLSEVLSKHGTVSRGVCSLDDHGKLIKVTEIKKIYPSGDKILFEAADGGTEELNNDDLCSMNMMGFTPEIIPFFQKYFVEFLEENINHPTTEFLMPVALSQRMTQEGGEVLVLPTTAQRFGVTYPEDKEETKKNIKKLISKGEYPGNLWK